MARTTKKEKMLTLEEKLAQALVPETEQPYKVPKNWCWINMADLALIISKGTTPKGGKAAYGDSGVKFLRVENICDDGTISHEGIMYVSEEMHTGFLKRSILQDGDILVSIAGTLGKTAIVRETDLPINTNQAVSFIRLKDKNLVRKYIKLSFDNPVVHQLLLDKTKVTSIPNLTLEIIGKCPVPLPPLAEQQRIVDRIESLFAKLDEAKEKAQSVVDGFENRKAAILHKAFTGELTAEWREKSGVHYRKSIKLGSCLKNMEMRKPNGEIFSYIDIDSIDNRRQVVRAPKKIPVKEAPSRASRAVHDGDVLFSMVRPYLKNIALIDESLSNCIASTGFYVCSPNRELDSKYLYHLLCSKDTIDYLTQFMKGDNSPSIRKTDLLEMEIILPSLLEQKQIEIVLDEVLGREQQAKEAAEKVIDKIDIMKKSILARAFRGELGTNDPADEPAEELLKRVL